MRVLVKGGDFIDCFLMDFSGLLVDESEGGCLLLRVQFGKCFIDCYVGIVGYNVVFIVIGKVGLKGDV